MSEATKLLSIIIPVYNTAKYLSDCFDSILNQGLKNYEVIIINDGSTDESKDIISYYKQKYSFIRYYEQENSGQGSARNLGINMAVGKYIYFMDSDDVLVNGKLREMLEMIRENNLDAIFFDSISFIDNHTNFNIPEKSSKRKKDYGYYSNGEELLNEFSINNELIISPCLFITKTELIRKNNLYFPIDYKHEDEYFVVTLFFYLHYCYHINDTVYLRRIRHNSTMTNNDKTPSFIGYVHILKYFHRFFETFHFRTKQGKKAYRKKMSQVTKSAYHAYHQLEKKQLVIKEYSALNDLTKKYNYYNITTYFYIIISRSEVLFNYYSKIANLIKATRKKSTVINSNN